MDVISLNGEEKIKVICKNNEFQEEALTLEKEYEVNHISDTHYTITDKSRIVAMSFCEPRSCIGRLSS